MRATRRDHEAIALGLVLLVPGYLVGTRALAAAGVEPGTREYYNRLWMIMLACLPAEIATWRALIRTVRRRRQDTILGRGDWSVFLSTAMAGYWRGRRVFFGDMIRWLLVRAGQRTRPFEKSRTRMMIYHRGRRRTFVWAPGDTARNIGRPEVEEFWRLSQGFAGAAAIFCLNRFTGPAVQFAEGKALKLVGLPELQEFYGKLADRGRLGNKRRRRIVDRMPVQVDTQSLKDIPEQKPDPARPRPAVGADKRCRFCDVLNAPRARFCKGCGAPF